MFVRRRFSFCYTTLPFVCLYRSTAIFPLFFLPPFDAIRSDGWVHFFLAPSLTAAQVCYQEGLERKPRDRTVTPRVHHRVAETLEPMGGYTDGVNNVRACNDLNEHDAVIYNEGRKRAQGAWLYLV